MEFIYDNQGRPYAMIYDGALYYYLLNQQGDVVIITSANGSTVGRYAYDAWGRVIYSNGTMCDVNPIRYRGYYYDSETGLYYLQSRYYDPLVKRFINPDSFASTGQGFAGYNMFAYCNNNPVMLKDSMGVFGQLAIPFAQKILEVILCAAGELLIWGTTAFCAVVFGHQLAERVVDHTAILPSTAEEQLEKSTLNLPGIASQYGNLKCVEAADAMAMELQRRKEKATIIELYFPDAHNGFVVSDRYSYAISETSVHYGVQYKGNVYCNVYPEGLTKQKWINSFYSSGWQKIVTEYSLEGWLQYHARNK